MAEELVTQTLAVAGAFDQTGNVGDSELMLIEAHNTEVRLEGGERVVGNLRLRRRDTRDQRAFAGVRETDQRNIGHEPQLEIEVELLAHLALLGKTRSATAVAQEAGVASS